MIPFVLFLFFDLRPIASKCELGGIIKRLDRLERRLELS